MKHTSKLFGAFEYTEDQVITFPKGLVGFRDYTKFVIKRHAQTAPVKWLLSVEDGGPDFAIVDPEQLDDRCGLSRTRVGRESLRILGAKDKEELRIFAVVTIPKDIRQISMNLRAPLLICMKTRRGLQRQESDVHAFSPGRAIYRELTGDTTEKTKGQLVILRKLNETIKIGNDIEIEVLAFEDGGVRLAVSAPKDVRITRGKNTMNPEMQMQEAATDMNVAAIKKLLREVTEPKQAAV